MSAQNLDVDAGIYEVSTETEASAHYMIPWSTQVHRFGPAFLRLETANLERETHPLVRSALKYPVVGHRAPQVGQKSQRPATRHANA